MTFVDGKSVKKQLKSSSSDITKDQVYKSPPSKQERSESDLICKLS